MRKTLWTAIVAAVALLGAAPQVFGAEGDNNSFNLALAPGVNCLATAAHARVTVSDLGPVQNLHLEVAGLTPKNSFTVFVTQHSNRPFGFSWYQGEVDTNARGAGVADLRLCQRRRSPDQDRVAALAMSRTLVVSVPIEEAMCRVPTSLAFDRSRPRTYAEPSYRLA